MSITILDVFAIAGFELVGHVVEDLPVLPTLFVSKDVLAYRNFLFQFYRTSGLVT